MENLLWNPAVITMGLMIAAMMAMLANRHFHNCDVTMSKSLTDAKKLNALLCEVTRRYPALAEIDAVACFIVDIENEIHTLKLNALGTDVLYIIKNLEEQKALLQKEYDHLRTIEVHNMSSFTVHNTY